MFAFVFMLPEEKRREKGGARQSRKNKIRYLFLLYAKKEALSSQSRKKTGRPHSKKRKADDTGGKDELHLE